MNVETSPLVPMIRDRLLSRLDEIDKQLTDLKNDLEEATSSQFDEGTLGNHPADEASDMLWAETDVSRIRELFAEQRDIAAAFERMESGTYGICIDCGDAIPPGRLEVIPIAKRCLTCQMQKERRERPQRMIRRVGVEEFFRV